VLSILVSLKSKECGTGMLAMAPSSRHPKIVLAPGASAIKRRATKVP
jgi:hypothetical protein